MIALLTIGIAITIVLGFGVPIWLLVSKSEGLIDMMLAIIITLTGWAVVAMVLLISYSIADKIMPLIG
ncbi:hypothetical protein [Bifidobacterium vansinderenii]|uniref:Uncharacterized protein n=1 Tax=Bifidobacterium vansinderenii TaxID=1984871 RepID=A0A229VWI5_9BIFI|nr:hypothetical protein [Bifidobacterium vansinderenii]OXM99895.1 hypothetical protein Tam10B_1858 [Bifidobacterium vansinderenii]